MKKYFKTLYVFCKNAYIRDKSIPGFVIGGVIFELIEITVTVVMFNVIFDNTKSLGGWNFYQTLFLYAFVKVIFALNNTFFKGGVQSLAREMIRQGTLDFHLTKPMHSLILLIISKPRIYPLINGFFRSDTCHPSSNFLACIFDYIQSDFVCLSSNHNTDSCFLANQGLGITRNYESGISVYALSSQNVPTLLKNHFANRFPGFNCFICAGSYFYRATARPADFFHYFCYTSI
jgi:hypothetical protein